MGGAPLEEESMHIGAVPILHAYSRGNKCIMECIILCSVLQRNQHSLNSFLLRKQLHVFGVFICKHYWAGCEC